MLSTDTEHENMVLIQLQLGQCISYYSSVEKETEGQRGYLRGHSLIFHGTLK